LNAASLGADSRLPFFAASGYIRSRGKLTLQP
jgi:hypothetical protein